MSKSRSDDPPLDLEALADQVAEHIHDAIDWNAVFRIEQMLWFLLKEDPDGARAKDHQGERRSEKDARDPDNSSSHRSRLRCYVIRLDHVPARTHITPHHMKSSLIWRWMVPSQSEQSEIVNLPC